MGVQPEPAASSTLPASMPKTRLLLSAVSRGLVTVATTSNAAPTTTGSTLNDSATVNGSGALHGS